jgi:hypothetical protein
MFKELEYIGNLDQLISLTEGRLQGGAQDGVPFMSVHNGGNLFASVLPGRCMDLYQVRYKGKNINYIAPCGIQSPAYYESEGTLWLRNFFVGQLTTCGLQHFGNPAVVAGEKRGLHGRISNMAAENVCFERKWKNDRPMLSLEGVMHEGRIFGENLTLHRKLDFVYEEDTICITDTIKNHGFGNRQVLYALHLNYGYPLLEEGTKILLDSEEVIPREQNAAEHLSTWDVIEPPAYPYPERCYFHKLKQDENKMVHYTVFNERRNIGVRVEYNGEDLPFFCEWKMMGKGEYVLGLEPMNVFLDGPKLNEPGCEALMLKPGEEKQYKVRLSYIDKI